MQRSDRDDAARGGSQNHRVSISYEWRGEFASAAVGALHAEGFGGGGDYDWRTQVERHSLGWVCAWQDRELVGISTLLSVFYLCLSVFICG